MLSLDSLIVLPVVMRTDYVSLPSSNIPLAFSRQDWQNNALMAAGCLVGKLLPSKGVGYRVPRPSQIQQCAFAKRRVALKALSDFLMP